SGRRIGPGTLQDSREHLDALRVLVDRLVECGPEPAANEAAVASDVVALIADCEQAAQDFARIKGVQIHRSGPSRLRCKLPPARLRSIVITLLENAIDCSPAGGAIDLGFFH